MFTAFTEWILRAFNKLAPDHGSTKLTNEALVNQLVKHFERQIFENSVKKRMLYPMAFYIFVHPEDWKIRKDGFQFIISDVVIDEFYNLIHRYLKRHPIYTSPAREWFFQFSEFTTDSIVTDNGERIQVPDQGSIYIMSSLFAPNILGNNGIEKKKDVRFSLNIKNSNQDINVNINPEAIARIDKFGEGVILRKFDNSLGKRLTEQQVREHSSVAGSSGNDDAYGNYPVLKWRSGGQECTYHMRSNFLIISGRDETMTGNNVLKIDDSNVATKHLRIVWDETSHRYLICAFAPTILNQREMNISTEDSPQYYPLTKTSTIILNLGLKITFSQG